MTTTAVAAKTVTITESRFVPGKGYGIVSRVPSEYATPEIASAEYAEKLAFWKGGQSEVLEQEGTAVEIQVGAWRRVLVELS
jgi:hypothetical protein